MAIDFVPTLFVADQWRPSEYALLDSGAGMKLERFGNHTVIRPDPQAFWRPQTPLTDWRSDAQFDAKTGEDERGQWRVLDPAMPDEWSMQWQDLRFHVRRSPFRHLGVFQEHSVHWQFAQDRIRRAGRPIKLLNLFGYTGMMSLAAAAAGAEVTHLDASPKSNGYGKINAQLSALDTHPIRWIADDAMKFTAREMRRGNHYDAIVLDPPKFGRGTKNEVWRFEENLPELLSNIGALLSAQPCFVILTAYAVRLSHIALAQALADPMDAFSGQIEMGEMVLPHLNDNRLLPTAICARWSPEPAQ